MKRVMIFNLDQPLYALEKERIKKIFKQGYYGIEKLEFSNWLFSRSPYIKLIVSNDQIDIDLFDRVLRESLFRTQILNKPVLPKVA